MSTTAAPGWVVITPTKDGESTRLALPLRRITGVIESEGKVVIVTDSDASRIAESLDEVMNLIAEAETPHAPE